jgi:putative membrane protein
MSAEPQPRRLHPIIPLVTLIRQIPELLLPMVGVAAVSDGETLATPLLAVGGLLTLVLAYQVLAWWRFTYTLMPDEMYIESGILTRNRRSIPWDRVQDVEIERGPLARLLGLAKVRLETGGSESDEGTLDSISFADAVALREEISARRGKTASHSGELTAREPPVFTMTTTRLFQAGLLNFSLVWLAVIMGAIQFFERLIPWTMKDIEKWIGLHEQELWGMVGPVSVVLALVLFLALGSIAGVVQMFVRNYGFTLWLERRTLRRVRGLLTRSEVAIPLRRIQAARTSAHWIKRHFGLCRVDVQTMGGSSSDDVQELAPLATADEAAHLLAIAGNFRLISPDRFQPVAPAHRWYDAQTLALPLALVALAAGFIWPPAWWGLAIAVVMGVAQVIGATPHGWRLEDDMLHVRSGWFGQEQWLLPRTSIQSLSLKIGPIQKNLNLASVCIDSAGAPSGALRIRNLPTVEARALVEKLRIHRRPRANPVTDTTDTVTQQAAN